MQNASKLAGAISAIALASIGASSALGDTFGYTGAVQQYTAPTTGQYNLVVSGARGGSSLSGGSGGFGATVSGTVWLTAGTVLDVVVGQQGGNFFAAGGAGGGGSFVYVNGSNVLVAAAGGGGGGASSSGGNGVAGENGGSATSGAGGTAGAGGQGGNSAGGSGGGGAGWLSAGGNPGGINSGTGGSTKPSFSGGSTIAKGGYGGGGGGGGSGGAGGGGYSGGGGADGSSANPSTATGGGGAGSYLIASLNNQQTLNRSLVSGGNTAANGSVTITPPRETIPPTVSSIVRAGTSPTNASSVGFTVTFSENVTGVDAADFALATSGVTGASVTNVSGSGTTYTVTVSTGSGDGTLRLDVADNDSIEDAATNKLGGTGAGNGNFNAGESYTLDKTGPTVSMSSTAHNPTDASPIPVSVTFSESVTGFTASDITPGNASVGNFAGSGASYSFNLTPAGPGQVTANIGAGVATDAVGNGNTAATQFSRTFTVATVASIRRASADPTDTNTEVNFTVTFSENVSGVDAGDFTRNATNLSGHSTVSVSSLDGRADAYTVKVNTGTRDTAAGGTLQLQLKDNDTIVNANGRPLGGPGMNNGDYTAGESYTVKPNFITAPLVVNTTADNGNGTCEPLGTNDGCTLREAIMASNADADMETITFAIPEAQKVGGVWTISLNRPLAALDDDVSITGPGANLLTVRPADDDRSYLVLFVSPGKQAAVSGVTLSGANGGLYNAGTTTVSNCTFSGNNFGFYSNGASTLSNCTFSGNPGIGVVNETTVTLTNCTFSGNGGGMQSFRDSTTTLTNSTVSANQVGITNLGAVTLKNSLVAGNDTNIDDANRTGTVTDGGGNITSGTAHQAGLETTDNNNAVVLKDNGGPTKTIALVRKTGAAINAGLNGNAAGLTTDGRGSGYPRIVAGTVDVGAFEFNGYSDALVVTTTADEDNGTSDPAFGSGTSLREAIAYANSDGVNSAITFDATVFASSQTITLGGTELTISSNLTITGPGANNLTVSGNNASRVFNISSGMVAISGLTVADGRAPNGANGTAGAFGGPGAAGGDGGGILVNGTLQLNNSAVIGSRAGSGGSGGSGSSAGEGGNGGNGGSGGGIFVAAGGALSVTNSNLSGNSTGIGGVGGGAGASGSGGSGGSGGGIFVAADGTLSVTNSSVSGNSTANGGSGGTGTGISGRGGAGGNGGSGGGISLAAAGTRSVTSSTLSGNTTGSGGSGGDRGGSQGSVGSRGSGGGGAGIFNEAGTVTITNSTLANNAASSNGGGIHSLGTTNIKNALIADNTAAQHPDVSGAFTSQGFNLIGDSSGATIGGDTTGNIADVDPKLDALGDYGGPTQTHRLQATSPAIDAGSAVSGLTTDQRGLTRPADFRCVADASGGDSSDIGAFEQQLPANSAPTASAGSGINTNEDTAVTVTLGGSDADCDPLSFKITALPSNGSLYAGADATGHLILSSELPYPLTGDKLAYQPGSNYHGGDSFEFNSNDGTTDGAGAAVSLTVNSVNDLPTAVNDSASTNEDTAVDVVVVANDTDADHSTAQLSVKAGSIANVSGGSAVLQADNRTVRFTPAADANSTATPGAFSFTYEVTDGTGNSANSATVTITVTALNDAPSFTEGADQTVNEDAGAQSVTGWASNISAGPANESNQTAAFTVASDNNSLFSAQPAISSDGSLTYTPAANTSGSATLTVTLQDNGGTSNGGQDTSAAQTFTITVRPLNDAPSFINGTNQTVDEDASAQVVPNWATNISAGPDEAGQMVTFTASNDNNALFSQHPAVSRDGTLSYTAAPNANGTSSVTVTLQDNGGTADGGQDTSVPQTFTITVNPVNDAPVASSQSLTVDEDTSNATTLAGSDADGDSLTFVVVTGPTNGALSGTGANRTYTPNVNYNGADSFTFKVNDGTTDSEDATVSITVNAVNDAPVANAQSVTTDEDAAKAITLTGSDPEGDTLSFSVVTGPTNGTLSGTGANRTYTPNANYSGPDSFTFKANDGQVDSNTGTVSITVTDVAEPSPSPSPSPSASPTPSPSVSPSRSLNISTRGRVGTGDRVLIAGTIISGNAAKKVIFRAIGPSLAEAEVSGALADPVLELYGPDGSLLLTNDNWKDDGQQAEIEASGLAPDNDLESAIVATLMPNNYTAIVRGKANTANPQGTQGIALAEIYDLDRAADSKLANISTRAFVETEQNVVIGGFLLGTASSSSAGSSDVIVRALGPSLSGRPGITSNTLADPTLELRDTNGTLVLKNDDWAEDPAQAAQITANALAPENSAESAIFATLPPGDYTALIEGKDGGMGIGLVEIYNLR